MAPPTPNFVKTVVYKEKKKKPKYFTSKNKYPCGNLQSVPNSQKPAEGLFEKSNFPSSPM